MSSQTSDTDDELLAVLLISMWTLSSGRTLPRDVPVTELSADELIAFWADDMCQPCDRPPVAPVPLGGRSRPIGKAAA